jgi:hypothetical protein
MTAPDQKEGYFENGFGKVKDQKIKTSDHDGGEMVMVWNRFQKKGMVRSRIWPHHF